ncbi:hypothetical protein VPH35_021340 [Triticum aestivum]
MRLKSVPASSRASLASPWSAMAPRPHAKFLLRTPRSAMPTPSMEFPAASRQRHLEPNLAVRRHGRPDVRARCRPHPDSSSLTGSVLHTAVPSVPHDRLAGLLCSPPLLSRAPRPIRLQ